MARKKTTRKKTARKSTARKKTTRKKTTARKTTRRRKTHHPKVAKHGKTAAARRKYIEYRSGVEKLKKEFFG